MMKKTHAVGIALVLMGYAATIQSASAAIAAGPRPDQIFVTEAKKTRHYIKEGLFTGGDRAITGVSVRDIRRAPNSEYERVVVDLEGNHGGEAVAIPRPPYFQVAMSQAEQRVLVTVWGNPRLNFDPKKVQSAFRKSAGVKQLQLLPRLEENSWTFALDLQPGRTVEVFELTSPVRIILDIRQAKVSNPE